MIEVSRYASLDMYLDGDWPHATDNLFVYEESASFHPHAAIAEDTWMQFFANDAEFNFAECNITVVVSGEFACPGFSPLS